MKVKEKTAFLADNENIKFYTNLSQQILPVIRYLKCDLVHSCRSSVGNNDVIETR